MSLQEQRTSGFIQYIICVEWANTSQCWTLMHKALIGNSWTVSIRYHSKHLVWTQANPVSLSHHYVLRAGLFLTGHWRSLQTLGWSSSPRRSCPAPYRTHSCSSWTVLPCWRNRWASPRGRSRGGMSQAGAPLSIPSPLACKGRAGRVGWTKASFGYKLGPAERGCLI